MLVHIMCRWKLPMNRPSPGLAATLSHRMGEGLGVRALFQWKFMAPMRLHLMCRWMLPMNLTFGNSKLLAFSPLTPALSPLRGEGAVHGPNARPKVGGPSYP